MPVKRVQRKPRTLGRLQHPHTASGFAAELMRGTHAMISANGGSKAVLWSPMEGASAQWTRVRRQSIGRPTLQNRRHVSQPPPGRERHNLNLHFAQICGAICTKSIFGTEICALL
jgi:hypothetical protein